MRQGISLSVLAAIVLLLAGMGTAEAPNRVTIRYDSFGKYPALTMGSTPGSTRGALPAAPSGAQR